MVRKYIKHQYSQTDVVKLERYTVSGIIKQVNTLCMVQQSISVVAIYIYISVSHTGWLLTASGVLKRPIRLTHVHVGPLWATWI